MPTTRRRLRHWKQQYNPNAQFIFRQSALFGDKTYQAGDPIPEELSANKGKLRRFWDARAIEIAEAPESRNPNTEISRHNIDVPAGWAVEQNVSWYTAIDPDGKRHKFAGRKRLTAFLKKAANA